MIKKYNMFIYKDDDTSAGWSSIEVNGMTDIDIEGLCDSLKTAVDEGGSCRICISGTTFKISEVK